MSFKRYLYQSSYLYKYAKYKVKYNEIALKKN